MAMRITLRSASVFLLVGAAHGFGAGAGSAPVEADFHVSFDSLGTDFADSVTGTSPSLVNMPINVAVGEYTTGMFDQAPNPHLIKYPSMDACKLGTDAFTITFKIKAMPYSINDDGGRTRRIFSCDGDVGNADGNLQIMVANAPYDSRGAGGQLFVFSLSSDPSQYLRLVGTDNIADGQWHAVAIRRSSGSTFQLWVDGNEQGFIGGADGPLCATGCTSLSLTSQGAPNPLFGKFPAAEITGRLVGELDDFSLYKNELTDQQIAAFQISG